MSSFAKPDLPALPQRLFGLLLCLLGLLAAALLYYSLPWGIGVSPDSVAYLKAASRLVADPAFAHLPSHWPPGYPLYLAALHLLIPPIALAALLGQALLYCLNTVLFGLALYLALRPGSPAREWLALLAGLLFCSNPAVLHLHQFAISEPLFISFLLGGLLLVLRWLERDQWWVLLLAALLIGMLPVVRYAGLVFLPAMALLVYLARDELPLLDWRRLRSPAVLLVVAMLPVLCWLGANSLLRGRSTNRVLVFHPAGMSHLRDLVETLVAWFPPAGASAVAGAVLLLTLALLLFALRRQSAANQRKGLIAGLLLACLAYIAFLFLSISLFDAYTPVSQRILLPVWILLFLAIFIALAALIRSHLALGTLLLAIVMATMVANVGRAAGQVRYAYENGLGYQLRGTAQLPILAAVKQELGVRTVYSNAADLIFLYTGQDVRRLPSIGNPVTLQDNPEFLPQMLQMVQEVDEGRAVVAFFHGFDFRGYLPTVTILQSQFGLASSRELGGGVLFDHWVAPAD